MCAIHRRQRVGYGFLLSLGYELSSDRSPFPNPVLRFTQLVTHNKSH
jgi:hypothetical protein